MRGLIRGRLRRVSIGGARLRRVSIGVHGSGGGPHSFRALQFAPTLEIPSKATAH
jgi:hypothetical protein